MKVSCPHCRQSFDDAEKSTICPHELIMPREDLDRKIAAIRLMDAKAIRFNHQLNGPDRRLQSISHDGFIEIEGFTGQFAPHLFTAVK